MPLAEESMENVRRIDGGIEMESSIPFQFPSIPFCNSNSNSNSMTCNSNSNSGIGIGIEVNSNSNSGIDPSPAGSGVFHDLIPPICRFYVVIWILLYHVIDRICICVLTICMYVLLILFENKKKKKMLLKMKCCWFQSWHCNQNDILKNLEKNSRY